MKKSAKLLAGLLAALMLLAGCSTGSGGGASSTSTAAGGSASTPASQSTGGGSGEKVTIRFENHGANKHELFSEACEIFNASQDEVYVDFQTNTEDWEAALWAGIAVDDAPDLFTHINLNNRMPDYVDAGHLADLRDMECFKFIKEDALSSVSYGDGVYAIPVQTEMYGVFYNKDYFEKAGVTELPTTLTELQAVVDQLKVLEADGIYPFAAQYRDVGQLANIGVYGAANSLWKNIDEQGLTVGDAKAGTNGFTYDTPRVVDVFKMYDIVRNNTQPRPEDTDYTTHNTQFAAGETAMLIMGNWIISQTRELAPDLNIGMFPLPVSEDPNDAMFVADYNLVINVNAHSKNLEAVDKFLTMFCDYTQPTKEFFIKNALPAGLKDFETIVTADPALEAPMAATETALIYGKAFPTGWQFGTAVQEYMLDPSQTPEQGAAALQADYELYLSTQ